LSNKIL